MPQELARLGIVRVSTRDGTVYGSFLSHVLNASAHVTTCVGERDDGDALPAADTSFARDEAGAGGIQDACTDALHSICG